MIVTDSPEYAERMRRRARRAEGIDVNVLCLPVPLHPFYHAKLNITPGSVPRGATIYE